MNQILHPLPCERLQERAFWAQGIAQTMEQCGKSLRDLPADLRQHCAPTDQSLAQISQTDMNRLWHAAARVTQDECFGLRMGQAYCSNTLKVLGLAAVSSETVGDAVQRVLRYISVFSTQVQLYSVEDDQYFTIYFEPRGTPHPLHMEAVVAQCAKIWSSLENGQAPLVLETRLAGEHEGTRPYCESVLSGKVRLGAKRIAVRMSRALLRNPLPSADAFLRKRLDASLEDMLGDLPNVNFAEQVKQRIRVLVAQREVSEDMVATPFNMSPRHLRRKLSETQTTYEKLLDEVRMELAMRLIQEGKLNLGRIAFELGFLDPSSFTRAFRRWTGMSPTAFKDRAHGRLGAAVV
ncbi:AraC-type DNA-binding protein [Halopseudomonas xinjiangensis]|uniref:AraC-type DNA-binding protein n=1 Tax=Halopseudomonas xinjiangensis TaxID=487184 RepID=A0A1H1NI87_9GAMM|nr:AraC family transcriptional regulator [Halopseudomonas xinjiangensis]SDR98684.1 AraC-type DNA-binding protein [Halopseudomonas xinjiangensis]